METATGLKGSQLLVGSPGSCSGHLCLAASFGVLIAV